MVMGQCPQTCSMPPPTYTSAGNSQTPTGKSGTVSGLDTAPFSWDLVYKVLLCPPRDCFQVLCKFWQLYGGVNGNIHQECLCHTQACCTQSPCPCVRLLPTCTFTEDAQTQFCLSLWNAKVGSEETPGVIGKFGIGVQNEAGKRLIEFCQENSLVIENTLCQQHKRRFYTWTSQDGQHQNQIDYILCSQRWRSSIHSAKTRPGADCGSDHELLIGKFRIKLKKVGKMTRPFRYDLNQIPNDYTVEARNRFKGLDLIERVPDELWMEVHDIVQETGIKTIPKKMKCKKAKWLSE